MSAGNNGAVFVLGGRAHYEVLEQPDNYDIDNGNKSKENIYENQSIEKLWPEKTTKDFDANYNSEKISWDYYDQNNTVICEKNMPCVKRRNKRRSSETLLCDEKLKPLNTIIQDDHTKAKPSCRVSLLSFLASLAHRKRNESEQVHYLQHFESVLTKCTYRESCRCSDCQGRYFDCTEDSDDYNSDNDYQKDVGKAIIEFDDDVFITTHDNDNTSTDLLLDDDQEEPSVQDMLEDEDTDKQLEMEVAASTSAMFNLLLYHPFSCSIQ